MIENGRQPAPVPASRYSAELMQRFAGGQYEAYLARGGRPLRPRIARSLALADLRPGLELVDIGCGRGEAALHCLRRGVRVTALDYSRGSLDLTRQTASLRGDSPSGRGRLWPAASDATSLPLADRSVDRVLVLDLIEHLHDWQLKAMLAEIRRIIRPGGYVVMHTLPNRWTLKLSYPMLRLVEPTLPAQARSTYEKEVHVNEQSPHSLHKLLRETGFESRVWVEEWTTRQARLALEQGRADDFPDPLRRAGYSRLAHPSYRRLSEILMRTPLRSILGNDIFAVAYPSPAFGAVPDVFSANGRFRALR